MLINIKGGKSISTKNKMTNKKIQEMEPIFQLCNDAYKKARKNSGVVIASFDGLESLAVEKLSRYMHTKMSDQYFLHELKGADFYEAHIKYHDKHKQLRFWKDNHR